MKDGLYHIHVTVNFDNSGMISEGILIGNGGAVFVEIQPAPCGHWIERPDLCSLLSIPEAYVCSECGKSAIEKHNYCNRCGAKMEKCENTVPKPEEECV